MTSIERLKELAQEKNAEWLGTSNINAIKDVLEILENKQKIIKDLDQENENKDKIIDLIVKEFYKKAHISTKCYLQTSIEECLKNKNCIVCIKEYFTKKVEGK